ncbi:MAG TPA: RagB/SusD family nutrient uptake outer membrane protein [Parasegetibacter sp.]
MRNKIFIALALSLVCATSCKRFLDLPPKNKQTVISIKNIEALLASQLRGYTERYIKPLYGEVTPACPVQAMMMFEAYSDNIDFEEALPMYLLSTNRYITTEVGYANLLLWNQHTTSEMLWKHHYSIVGFMNSLIDQMDEIDDATPAQRDQVLGEMYAMRAFSLFKLQQYFAPYDKAEMGIPVYLHTGKGVLGVKMPRLTHAEVYKIILEDLGKALEYVTRTAPRSGYNVLYNERYLNHLIAQVYWFKAESPAKEEGDYEKVKTHSLKAIENLDAVIPKTAAARITAYGGADPNYPAVVQENNQQGGMSGIYGSEFQYLSETQYTPSKIPLKKDFADLFVPTDIRIENYFNTNPARADGRVGTEGRVLNWAWPCDGTTMGNTKRAKIVMFKPEEAYLMLAEAQFRTNSPDQAVATLNKFKGFRNAGTVSGTTGDALLQEIIDERRRELFGDTDKRWLDLKRYGRKTITRNLTFFGDVYNITVEPNDFRYALPIPLSEIQDNNNIKPNPGWQILEF